MMTAQQNVEYEKFCRDEERQITRERKYREVGDERPRCDAVGHLLCDGCGECACQNDTGGDWEITVRTDKKGRSLCKECRYDADARDKGWW